MAVKRGLGKGLDSMIPVRRTQSNEGSEEKDKKEEVIDQKAPTTESPAPLEGGQKEGELSSNADANVSSGEDNIIQKSDQIQIVKISSVEPNKQQPRKNFDEDSLEELAGSIQQHGVLQPILVVRKDDYYEIIAGERRWRAAKIAGLTEIPIIVKEMTEIEKVEVSLIENIQREDLNPIEEAKAYQQLIEVFHLKQEDLAQRVSKNRSTITNAMRLLKLDDKVQQMLVDEMISAGHARALLALEDKEAQRTLAMKIFDDKLSVRETEKLIKKMQDSSAGKKVSKKDTNEDFTLSTVYENMEERIKRILGSKVQIQRRRNNKGKIEIEYYSQEDLERIIDLFESIGISDE